MTRVLVELFAESIEGVVIDAEGYDEANDDFDLEGTFTVRCDDGACFIIHGWMADVTILSDAETETIH